MSRSSNASTLYRIRVSPCNFDHLTFANKAAFLNDIKMSEFRISLGILGSSMSIKMLYSNTLCRCTGMLQTLKKILLYQAKSRDYNI